jgi:hypothetical protein
LEGGKMSMNSSVCSSSSLPFSSSSASSFWSVIFEIGALAFSSVIRSRPFWFVAVGVEAVGVVAVGVADFAVDFLDFFCAGLFFGM